jgi:hypothetical protein
MFNKGCICWWNEFDCVLTSERSNLSTINISYIFAIFQVTSKPDLYPLVISYGDSGKGGTGGNYLMVQYFRNYIVHPVGKHKIRVMLEVYEIILRKNVRLWSAADIYECFGVTCCLHLKGRRWEQQVPSTCMYLTNYRTSRHITSHHITSHHITSHFYIHRCKQFSLLSVLRMHCLVLSVFWFSGSLSATSTADSLSSSFLCNAVNEVSIRNGHTNFFQSAETATCHPLLLDLCHSSIIISATSVTFLLAMILLTLLYSIND